MRFSEYCPHSVSVQGGEKWVVVNNLWSCLIDLKLSSIPGFRPITQKCSALCLQTPTLNVSVISLDWLFLLLQTLL